MGRYEGKLVVTWHPDGRHMELNDSFAFIDGKALRWDVCKGAQIDGASIPQILWPIAGSPYTGKYRDASVVHDYYCSIRTRTSDATHRMFYEAMLVSGVTLRRANLMYAAVKYAGPRWSDMDTHNANVASEGRWAAPHKAPGGMPPAKTDSNIKWFNDPKQAWAWAEVSADEFLTFKGEILDGTIGLDEIDASFGVDSRMGSDLPSGLFRFGDDPRKYRTNSGT